MVKRYNTELILDKFRTESDEHVVIKASNAAKVIKLAKHMINSFCDDDLELHVRELDENDDPIFIVNGNEFTQPNWGTMIGGDYVTPKDCMISALEFYNISGPEKYIKVYET